MINIETIIFDWKGTLYDSEAKELFDDSLEVLNILATKGLKMYLVGKNKSQTMYAETERLKVDHFFDDINFVTDTKTQDHFSKYMDSQNPEHTLVVGDRVRSEIEVGNQLGALTAWVRRGQFASEEPQEMDQIPTFMIGSVKEILILPCSFNQ